jgi:zona occludens toxin
MITMFTGSPGAGKTASLVDFLSKLEGNRPIYADGLEGLKLPHTPVDSSQWHTELPDGAILVIDEAQRVWRPRGSGAKVPESVAALETHRHRGIDVYLTTQAPALIDSNVRNLVGRHVHIRDTGVFGRYWYEWPEVSTGMTWKTCINKKRYKLPKKAFDLYTSSSLHVAPVRGIPPMLYVTGGVVLLAAVMVYFSYTALKRRIMPAPPAPPVAGQPATQNTPTASPAGAQRQIDDRVDWIPRISNRPETAPAYDHLRVVVAMPIVTGAICINGKCKCLTNQGTDAGLSPDECHAWTTNRPFNPYLAASENSSAHSQNLGSSGAGQAAGFPKTGAVVGVAAL